MKRESLDTNILLRLMLADVSAQYDAAKKLVQRKGKRYFVSDAAIVEFIFVLERHYGFSRQQGAEMTRGLLSIKKLDCNRELILEALGYYAKYKSLSFEDCYLTASAKTMNASPLWTFDKDLVKMVPDAVLLSS
jgi:predicted nucleic-acid-binding protein